MFELNSSTRMFFDPDAGDLTGVGHQFIAELKEASGFEIQHTDQLPRKNGIIVQRSENMESEAYELVVDQSGITITARTTDGVYYALQTIKQLLPVEFAASSKPKNAPCIIPAVTISDQPGFAWRGYMLDVSRHFYRTEDVKKVLDFMAMLKLNRFHWHLTDDQGWRIEIKKYPALTSVGAWRVDYNVTDENISNWWGRPVQKKGEKAAYGGFYTQDEIKEIVEYAKARHIEIIPEIDVPGHSQAILASYPEVSCDNRNYYVATGGVYKDNALCASNPVTYQFLEEVLGEVMDLFPFNYIHIGGDECNKEGWKKHKDCQEFIREKGLKGESGLQSYFIKQVEKMVQAKGKNLIGWEILEGGLAPNATVMSWRGEKGGIAAARAGHDVIMTPNYANYLDLKQGQTDFEPNLGYSEALLSTCYNYSVIPEGFSGDEASHVLGLQGNLWTESISDWGKLTYMTFPRLFAVAENGWTPENKQNFDEFVVRLEPQLRRLDAKGIRYAKSAFNVWIHQKGNGENIQITLDSELTSPEIRYTLDGTDPTSASDLYSAPPITLKTTQTIKTAIFKNGKRLGDINKVTYPIHKAAGAKVVYNQPYSGDDPAAKELALTDLNYGQLDARGDDNWQGFTGDFDVTLIFDDPVDVNLVRLTSLRMTIGGKYPPTRVEVFASADGKNFSKTGDSGFRETSLVQGRNKINVDTECPASAVRRLRVKARLVNPIPEGHHKAGSKSTLLVDEVVVL